jgi:hypothetical protein
MCLLKGARTTPAVPVAMRATHRRASFARILIKQYAIALSDFYERSVLNFYSSKLVGRLANLRHVGGVYVPLSG